MRYFFVFESKKVWIPHLYIETDSRCKTIERISPILSKNPKTQIYRKELEEIPILYQAFTELNEYFDGKRKTFEFEVSQNLGTSFQKQVWKLVDEIPYGKTMSYSQIASKLDKPGAVRAVGAANSKNPLLICRPCHRVIGKNGKLTGYLAGIEVKKRLLELENTSSE